MTSQIQISRIIFLSHLYLHPASHHSAFAVPQNWVAQNCSTDFKGGAPLGGERKVERLTPKCWQIQRKSLRTPGEYIISRGGKKLIKIWSAACQNLKLHWRYWLFRLLNDKLIFAQSRWMILLPQPYLLWNESRAVVLWSFKQVSVLANRENIYSLQDC